MTYEEFSDLLWEKQSLKGKWQGSEVHIMKENGCIYVKGSIDQPIETYPSISAALDSWSFREARTALSEFVEKSTSEDWEGSLDFADIAVLDNDLFTGPTQIRRNSLTFGKAMDDSSLEHSCILATEKINACLYGVSANMRIYHTLPWHRFKEMLENGRLFLKNPLEYNDRWESFLFNKNRNDSKGNDMAWGISCWSLREESEGLWNNYVRGSRCTEDQSERSSQEMSGLDLQMVKIETTVGDLLLAILDNFGQSAIWEKCRVGRVKYYDEFFLKKFKKHVYEKLSNWGLGVFIQACLQSFFMKRLPYDYEQEVRLVALRSQDMEVGNKGFYLKLKSSPTCFIHEVVVNPNCRSDDYQTIKAELTNRWKIDRVRMSSLAKEIPQDI